MADKEDYLTEYRRFFEDFAANVNPDDQLPVRIASYEITQSELTGEILTWTIEYLNQKQCPLGLLIPLCRIVLQEMRDVLSKEPNEYGCQMSRYKLEENVFKSLQLMKAVTARANTVCLRYLDNSKLDLLPPPPTLQLPKTSVCAIKNYRNRMEDRHTVIDNLNAFFAIEDTEPTGFYAVYDGHSGSTAASYAAAHLHQYLAESRHFLTDPRKALVEAFVKTDDEFVRKRHEQNNNCGTTAAVVIIRGSRLHAAWVGDSQALLVSRGRVLPLVTPHKPDREDEKKRIEQHEEGFVLHACGAWRVCGRLAVSRAIGDPIYKPFVSGTPDVETVALDGEEDFVVVATDGLWDVLSEDEVALTVYRHIVNNPDDLSGVSSTLCDLARRRFSSDNISAVVVLLQPPHLLAARSHPYLGNYNHMELGASVENGAGGKPAVSLSARLAELGPESAVDAADEELLSPALAAARALVAGDDADTDPQPVHDGSALVDNVGESGEESEDEWNYYKGDQTKEKEIDELQREPEEADLNESQESVHQPSEDIDMNTSPLNPEAAPFVPVSPTRPAFGQEALAQRLLHDELIAESPKKPLPMDDIDVPDRNEFDNEAFKRPAELVGDFEYSNGHGDGMLENIKDKINGNGKQEFGLCEDGAMVIVSPTSFDDHPLHQEDFERVQKDTMGFGDIQVTFAQTEGYINPIDSNIDEELFERLKSKERDPMSMSFYQEKDEDTCETGYLNSNPFDLNAVHDLPADSDEELISNEPHENGVAKESNPFSDNATSLKDVSSSEIIAAITDLDNVVHHEADLSEHREGHSPFLDPAGHSRGISPIGTQSPLSDNVSQLTEPSEEDHRVQAASPIEALPSDGDSALSRHISSPAHCPLVAEPNADPTPELCMPDVQEPLITSQSPLPESKDALLNFSNEFVSKREENSICELSEVESRHNATEFDTFSSELKDFTLQSVDIVPESDKLLFEEIPEIPKDKLDLLQYDGVSQKLSELEAESEGTNEMGEEPSDISADLEIISGIANLKVADDHIAENEFNVSVGKEIHDDYLAQENIDALIQPEERSKDESLVESLEGCDTIVNQVSEVKDILIMSNEERDKNEVLTEKIDNTYGDIESDLKNVNLEENYIPNVESEFMQSEKALPDFEFDEKHKAVESTFSSENLLNEDIQVSENDCMFADSSLPVHKQVSHVDDQDSPVDEQIAPVVEDIVHLGEPVLAAEKPNTPDDVLILPVNESPLHVDEPTEEPSSQKDKEILPKTETHLPITDIDSHDMEIDLSSQETLPPSDSGFHITEVDTFTVEKLEAESSEREALTPEVDSLPHIETSKDVTAEGTSTDRYEVVNEPLEVDLVADICQLKAQEICEPITQEIDNPMDQIIDNTEKVTSLSDDINARVETEKLEVVAADILQSQEGDILQQNSLTNGTVDLLACSIPHAINDKEKESVDKAVEQVKTDSVEASLMLFNDVPAQQLDSLKIESGTPSPTPALEIPQPETLASSPPPSELVQAMEKLTPVVDIEPQEEKAIAAAAISAAAVGAVAAAGGAATIDKKTSAKPKTPASAAKKPGTATKSPSSPTKPSTKPAGTATPKTPSSAAAKKPVTGVSRTPLSTTKPSSATPKPKTPLAAKPSPKPTITASPASRPKPASAPSSAKLAEKKPLTNGDAKLPAKRLTAAKPAAATKPAAARPATVPPSKPATTRAPLAMRSAPPKPTSAAAAATKPKPAPATTARPASARPAPTARAPPAKPVLDKQVKDLANKQLSSKPAPRTTLSKTATTESKMGTTKIMLTKTTSKTTTTATMTKKPLGASKLAPGKTTTRTSATKPASAKAPVQNGPPAPIRRKVVQVAPAANGDVEMNGTHLITDDDTLRKDDSPQQVDNSMLPLAVD